MITPATIASARKVISDIYVDDRVKEYILDIVFATEQDSMPVSARLNRFVEVEQSSREYLAARARAHMPS